MKHLDGQGAVVTGGAKGIGLAIARALGRAGAGVLLADLVPEVEDAAALLRREGLVAQGAQIDLSRVESHTDLVDRAVGLWGSLDILVNNAGKQKPHTSLQMTTALYDEIMNINLRTPFFLCQAAARRMKAQGGGVIVNISSGNSRMVNVGRAPYTISKAGVNAMTAVLGAEWAMFGIRVNAVAPGWIETDMTARGIASGALNPESVSAVVPMPRWGKPDDVADAVLFLAGEQSRYINGQTLFVDGGWNTGILPGALEFIRREDG